MKTTVIMLIYIKLLFYILFILHAINTDLNMLNLNVN